MKNYEQIKNYAKKCISGEIISCKKHKWACERFLRDAEKFETDPEYPYYWNEEAAQSIVDWFALLRHSKGILAGKPILLTELGSGFESASCMGGERKRTGCEGLKSIYGSCQKKRKVSGRGWNCAL